MEVNVKFANVEQLESLTQVVKGNPQGLEDVLEQLERQASDARKTKSKANVTKSKVNVVLWGSYDERCGNSRPEFDEERARNKFKGFQRLYVTTDNVSFTDSYDYFGLGISLFFLEEMRETANKCEEVLQEACAMLGRRLDFDELQKLLVASVQDLIGADLVEFCK